ncbi:MAG: carbamate kinase [Sphaerochaetaceae bacterium]
MDSKLIVIAIGGNSLIEDSKHVTVSAQYEAARKTASHIVTLVQAGHRVVIVHGNGPQVGYILLRAEYSRAILHSVPLDSCVADTQGAIGYNLQMALDNEFRKVGMSPSVVTIVTQVEVSDDDPSFKNPTKPIGSFLSKEDAEYHAQHDGWSIVEDAGRGYRRVVPSPQPKAIIELRTIGSLLSQGVIVIAAGGGGIPVVREEDGTLHGREAVIDKDLAAALLAKQLGADLFIISTAVEKVSLNYGKSNQEDLSTMTVQEAKEYMKEGHFAPGSMLPKIQAMMDFVSNTGNRGIITNPEHLLESLDGGKGTTIVNV